MFAIKILNRYFIFSLNWLNVLPNFMWIAGTIYRWLRFLPTQTKFSQVSVCPWGGSLARGCLCPGVSLSGGVCVQGRVSVRVVSVQAGVTLRYCGDGTHPTGMHSCFLYVCVIFVFQMFGTKWLELRQSWAGLYWIQCE